MINDAVSQKVTTQPSVHPQRRKSDACTNAWHQVIKLIGVEKQELRKKNEELQHEIEVLQTYKFDALTELIIRRAGEAECRFLFNNAQDNNLPFSIVFIDEDNLKQINDTLSHSAGDASILLVAQAVRDSCQRATDVITRWGGDEILIAALMTEEEARGLVQKIKRYLAVHKATVYGDAGSTTFTVSVSAGIAEYHRSDAPITLEQLVHLADMKLKTAKKKKKIKILP